jgi:hypothetical protein
MSEQIQLRRKAQLTLPQSVRKKLGIEEGDFLEQAWFWSKRWQRGENEAEADMRAGRVHKFPHSKAAVDFLHRQTENR